MKLLIFLLALGSQSLKTAVKSVAATQNFSSCTEAVIRGGDLMPYILDMISDPSSISALVCKDFAVALKYIDMAGELAKIGFPLSSDGVESDTLMYYQLRDFFKDRLSEVFADGSVVMPESVEMAKFALAIVLGNPFISSTDKRNFVRSLCNNLAEKGNFETLMHLSQIAPADMYVYPCIYSVAVRRFLYEKTLQGPSIVLEWLKNNCKYSWESKKVFSIILSARMPVHILKSLPLAKDLIMNAKFISDAIVESCILDFVEYTHEQQIMLHARNAELLASFAELEFTESSSLAIAYLINSIRFSTVSDEVMIKVVIDFLKNFSTDCKSHHINLILTAAVHSDRATLFQTILNDHPPTSSSDDLMRAVVRHSRFAGLMSSDNFDIISDPKILVHVAKFEMQERDGESTAAGWQERDCKLTRNIEKIRDHLFRDDHLRLLVTAVTRPLDDFAAAVSRFGSMLTLDSLYVHLVNEHENPIPLISTVLQQVRKKPGDLTLNMSEKYWRILLGPNTSQVDRDAAVDELKLRKTFINVHFIHALLTDAALVNLVSLEANLQLLVNFRINWNDLFAAYSLNIQQLLRIFQVLQMPIKDLSFSVPITFERIKQFDNVFEEPLEKIAKHTSEPDFLMHLIRHIAAKDVKNRFFCVNAKWKTPNPFLLRSFYLCAWWMHRNFEHFARFAPLSVYRAFMPESKSPPVPNPLLPESAHLFEEMCRESYWLRAPLHVIDCLESFRHLGAKKDLYPLRNCDPFFQWYNDAVQNFEINAPPQAIRAMYRPNELYTFRWLKDYGRLKERENVILEAILKDRNLFFSFPTEDEMHTFYKKYLSDVDEKLLLLNCRIHLSLDFDRSIMRVFG